MAKSGNQDRQAKAASPEPKAALPTGSHNALRTHYIAVACITAITFVVLSTCLSNQFTNWDDPGYIHDNTFIKTLSADNLRKIFTEPVMGNYHPLTILSYALEYSIVKLEPWWYHFDNLLLHLLCTILSYVLAYRLLRHQMAAAVVALLFGLHPMHVESVAWVSGRKDVLYGFFFLAACIAYTYYIEVASRRRRLLYAAVLLLFVCSALSKPVAVTLPLTLLVIDYLRGRQWSMHLLTEKLPHLVIAVIFGIIAIRVQQQAGALAMQQNVDKVSFNGIERFALGCYALITYLWKFIAPMHLLNFYPYPQKVNGALSGVFYVYPAIVAILIFLVWKFLRHNRIVIAGIAFFIINIALLLQFLPVGTAIVADRYSYIPYFGLFLIAGWLVMQLSGKAVASRRYIVWGVCILYTVCIGYLTYERCTVWYDAVSLWRDEIEKEPVRATNGYNNLGYIYYNKWAAEADLAEKQKDFDSAYYLLHKAIALQPAFVNPYISLGDMLRATGRFDDARNNYFEAAKYNPKETNIYLGLAILYFMRKSYDTAGHYFRQCIAIKPSSEAYGNYGSYLTQVGKSDSAIIEFTVAISMNPEVYSHYMSRGVEYKKVNRWQDAQSDFTTVINANPDAAQAYYERSACYQHNGDRAHALTDVEKAISLGYNRVDNEYYRQLQSK